MKFLWKNISTRVWTIVTSVTLVLMLTVTVVATQLGIASSTLDILFGSKRAIIAEGDGIYTSDYENKEEALQAATAFNIDINREGIILLKNEDNSLPIDSGSKVTVFGKNSVNLVTGGSGSGSVDSAHTKTIYDSLSAVGINYNQTMLNFYQNNSSSGNGRPRNPSIGRYDITGFAIGETPISNYTSEVRNSYSEYNDAAIVVISRIGGEGFDLPRTMFTSYSDSSKISGARNSSDHYLQLDDNETNMLKEANDNFNKVIVVINASQTIELGFLDDSNHYAYQPNIKAALQVGSPGANGIMALGEVLTGKVNPSGKTVGTYSRDFTKDPSYNNFGDNMSQTGNRYQVDDKLQNAYFVDYEEGIYIGYRYYETRGYTDGETWYNQNVVFPFGYGLSYTDFEWEVTNVSIEEGTSLSLDDEIIVSVEVTNTGNYDGKDVVQLYYTAPYYQDGIEKAHVVLGGFAKTDLLSKNGGKQTVDIKLAVSEMKSYDYNDKNGNGHYGYELEKGEYVIKVATDAHNPVAEISYQIDEDIKITTDEVTGNKVENRFDDVSERIENNDGYLSRTDFDGTWPTRPDDVDRTVTQALINALKYDTNDSDKPYYSDDLPEQPGSLVPKSLVKVSLHDVVGLDYDDPLWDELLDSLTYRQMADLIGNGAFTTIDLENISKPKTIESDGPSGFTNFMALSGAAPIYDTASYAAQAVLGATWNIDLAKKMGLMIGNEGLIGNERGDGLPYSGWYAPGVNLHRSPFGGRNWEYYSEDPYLSGMLASHVILGASEKGVYTFLKHFAVNDQETHRDFNGMIVWANEQSMREIYFKPFEMAVKIGKTTAIMSAFNRLGTTWTGGDYRLLTEVLRDEWGFEGMVITDYGVMPYLDSNLMIRAGGDLHLGQGLNVPSTNNITPTQGTHLRRATKNILYTVANSNAMNNIVLGYKLPIWQVILFTVDTTIIVGLATWGFFVIRKAKRRSSVE